MVVAILDHVTFEQIWLRTTRQYYIPNLKHLSQAILEEAIFKYFSFLNTRPPVAGPFSTKGLTSEQTC